MVYDVDVLGTDPSHFEEDAEGLHPPMAPYLHTYRDWPDGSYLRTLCVHGGKLPPPKLRGKLRGNKVVGYASVTDPIDKRTTGEGAPSRG